MDNKTMSEKPKYIQPVIIAIVVAVLSAAGGAIYMHEGQILGLDRDMTALQKRVYRLRMSNFEYHDNYVRSEIQMLELRKNKTGELSVVDQTRLVYLQNLKETIAEKRTQTAEEGINNG